MTPNKKLLLPYLAPYAAYVLLASLLEGRVSPETGSLLRILVVLPLLLWAWRAYCPFRGPKSASVSVLVGVAAGVCGVLLWIALMAPFVGQRQAQPWSQLFFLLKLPAAGLLVPVFEELLMRGFVFRFALQWDRARKSGARDALQAAFDERSVNDVAPGDWSWAAVLLSTAAFTLGHDPSQWLAAAGFGLLMAGLWIVRKDLLTCVVAHAVTNVALACWIFSTGSWNYW